MASLLLRLPRACLARRDIVHRLAATRIEESLFALKCDELEFARGLLARRSNLWLYRTSQRAFAGDFVIVDLSHPSPSSRTVVVTELKRGERVRVGAPSSVQLRNATAAVSELAARGIVDAGADVFAITGDARAVLDHLLAGSTR
jgi:hypothetical protein